jgi:hypothetical protein
MTIGYGRTSSSSDIHLSRAAQRFAGVDRGV